MNSVMKLDPMLQALYLFKWNKVAEAKEVCTSILEKNPHNLLAWGLKMACLTNEVYIDELENDERGIAEIFLEDNILATNAQPGTSLSRPMAAAKTPNKAIRPRSSTGLPLTGFIRNEVAVTSRKLENFLKTSRRATTSRSASSNAAHFVRLGTASMLSQENGPFINLSRLNVNKYASDSSINQTIFEYIFHVEGAMMIAHEFATVSLKSSSGDWFWKNQLGKCCYRIGLYNDSIRYFLLSLSDQKMMETYAYLAKIYCRIDQPNVAIKHYKSGLQVFRNDTTLLIGLARVHEQLGDIEKSVEIYKTILRQDPSNVEAIACVATNFFYSDQPEVALRYYRRILQSGVNKSELFMDLGLCCFYCQQYDLAISCIERAQATASDDVIADIWYNIANIFLACGDSKNAERSYLLALTCDAEHAESICNLAALKMHEKKFDESKIMFQTAMKKGPHLFEPFFNAALLAYQLGRFEESRILTMKSLKLFPNHHLSQVLLNYIDEMYRIS